MSTFSGEKTLPMTVANTGFMLDRLGQDCAPLQFLRELTQNAIEAIAETSEHIGEVVWDVDWDTYELTGHRKLCIIDSGVGMTGDEMVLYINQLSSSVHQQSHEGNFGVGAKIAAATRNHEGLIYLSWKNGVGSMIHLWRDPITGDYGLRQWPVGDDNYSHWVPVEDAVKPAEIGEHGTKVVLLGMEPEQNTMVPPEGAATPSIWIAKYLNTRYFRFPEGVTVKAREGWELPRESNDNWLRTVRGQESYLNEHSDMAGSVELTDARAHWWILKDEKAISQQSGKFASSGHAAALYNDELYELQIGRSGVARLQLFGVIFGHQRVVIYVEPTCEVTSNTSRTHLILNGEPLPWADWAAEFREKMPAEIKAHMEEVTAGASSEDHRQAIRERLKQIRDLFRISRYRPTPKGAHVVDVENLRGGAEGDSADTDKAAHGKSGGAGGRAGNIYALFLAEQGSSADETSAEREPKVDWVTVAEGTRTPGDLEDRAARYLYEQNRLLINGDFRVFTDMADRWCSQYKGVSGARDVITNVVREWFEQSLIEAVLGAQALHGQRWTPQDVKVLLSEEALTAAVLPRYHIDLAIKRGVGTRLGSLKDKVS